MELYFKIVVGLLLLVQACHLASLQDPTDSPGRTIDKSWLRELVKNAASIAFAEEKKENNDQEANSTSIEPSNEYSGIASGSMVANNRDEEENVARQDKGLRESDDLSDVNNNTAAVPRESQDDIAFTTNGTSDPTNSSQVNMTETGEGFNSTEKPQNSTTLLPIAQSSTAFPEDNSNHTDLLATTLAPEGNNATQESTTTAQAEDTGSANETKSTNTTTLTTTVTPETNETSTAAALSTAVFPSQSTTTDTETSPVPPTTVDAAPDTPENATDTDKAAASGSSSERGMDTDTFNSNRRGAWGAVLGTGVAVAFVALVAYIIVKNRRQKGFVHKKLVEVYPADPVLRLDNSEPLDLAYYNPTLQGDDIQMSSIPGRR